MTTPVEPSPDRTQCRVLLEVENLSKTFATTTVLSDMSFELHAGEVLAALGHNGSGKSTLVKILAGVHEADPGGEIRVADGDDLQFIHQDLGLVNTLTAIENLGLGTSRAGAGCGRSRRGRTPAGARCDRAVRRGARCHGADLGGLPRRSARSSRSPVRLGDGSIRSAFSSLTSQPRPCTVMK